MLLVLLKVGADGNGPLHVVSELRNGELLDSVGNLLLEFGAHLDRVNAYRKTVGPKSAV